MIIKKTFRYRLRPDKVQRQLFLQFAGACRWVYNRGLAQRKDLWEQEKKRVTIFDQNKELSLLKKREETLWLGDIHSQVLQQALHDLDSAFNHFFRRVKKKEVPGHPNFKSKGDKDSFRYPQGVKINGSKVWLPKIGWVRFRKSREVEGGLKQTTVISEGGKWYVCFSCEWEERDPQSSEWGSVIGIDLGLETFATIATEGGFEEVVNPRFYRKELSHIRYLGRQLSKKKNRSNNRLKAKAKLQLFCAKIRARRNDFLHKLSTEIVKSHDIITVESLKIKDMLMSSSRSLSCSISDAGWGQFLLMLKYKSEYYGKKLVEANQYFASTQICSNCGKKNAIGLSIRKYSCGCGLEIHRDQNAALNLRAVGTTVLKACGAAL